MNETNIIKPFGPTIGVYDLEPETLQALKDVVVRIKDGSLSLPDVGDYLAGVIEEQYDVTSVVTQDHMDDIFTKCHQYLSDQKQEIFPMACQGVWMNIQKAHEVNPPHEHTGAISFVAYVQSGLKREDCTNNPYDRKRKNKTGRKEQIGGILEFRYGTASFLNNHTHEFFPEEGKIIFFPSWLQHMVMPFYKEGVERISIAGNIDYYQE